MRLYSERILMYSDVFRVYFEYSDRILEGPPYFGRDTLEYTVFPAMQSLVGACRPYSFLQSVSSCAACRLGPDKRRCHSNRRSYAWKREAGGDPNPNKIHSSLGPSAFGPYQEWALGRLQPEVVRWWRGVAGGTLGHYPRRFPRRNACAGKGPDPEVGRGRTGRRL